MDAAPRRRAQISDSPHCTSGDGFGSSGPWCEARQDDPAGDKRNQSVRMLAHLMDLGVDGAVPNTAAKKMVLQDAGGDVARA